MPRAGGPVYSHGGSIGDRYQGYYVDLLDVLASHLGLKFDLYLVPDNQYGRQLPDGKWNGIINQLLIGVRNKNLREISWTLDLHLCPNAWRMDLFSLLHQRADDDRGSYKTPTDLSV